MDIKDLNKHQLILLALLLSFVISIATGITTVTLMQQAPASVTVPINRVVRETVEKIVPGATTNNVQTVVVKEEDLVVDAIAKNQSAIFTVTKNGIDATTGVSAEVSAGRGVAVSKDGVMAVDATLVPDKEVYYATNASGKFKADFVSIPVDAKGSGLGFSFLKIGDAVDGKSKLSFTVPDFGDLSKMKAGQKIIVLGDDISSFIFDGSANMKINSTKSNAGGLVLDLDGNVLGMVSLSDGNSFVPIANITDALKPAETPKTP